jgi:hypothetical protein
MLLVPNRPRHHETELVASGSFGDGQALPGFARAHELQKLDAIIPQQFGQPVTRPPAQRPHLHQHAQRAAQARQRFPGLWLGGWAALALTLPLLALGWTDARLIDGVSVWAKPWKFHLSVGVHLLTLAWLATYLSDTPARARALGRLTAVALACAVFELAYITWRAAQGEPSHFNIGTPFAGAMYALMGLGAVLLTGCAGMSEREKRTAIGAGVGAVGGAVLTGGSALGTAGGAAVGGIIGNQVKKPK